MKIKLLALLMALLFAKEISAQGYDQFVWTTSAPSLGAKNVLRFAFLVFQNLGEKS